MKFSAVAAAIPALAGVANAFYSKEDYVSGKVHQVCVLLGVIRYPGY